MKSNKSIAILSSLLLSTSMMAESNSEQPDPTLFQPEDIFQLEVATAPQVSPDGDHIVYVRRSNDIMTDTTRSSIWIADSKGESHRPLLSSKKNYYSPKWSPDGSRLAYLSNSEGKPQLYVRWLDSGQTALITNIASSPSSITWSPDGKSIAFTMSVDSDEKPFKVKMPKKPKGAKWSESFQYITKARYQADGRGVLDPAYTHIFVVPAEGGTARQLTSGNFHHRGSLSFAADSQSIYFSANRSENWEYEAGEADIFSVSMAGQITQITDYPGIESSPVVSPNGEMIAY